MPHNIDYMQVNAGVGVVGTNFPSATIPFNWTARSKIYPEKCFINIRLKITNGDGSLIAVVDSEKAINMNLVPCIFNNVRLIKDGKEISKCSTYVGEIDSLKNRIMQSDAYLNTTGNNIYWQPLQQERQNIIASDGYISELAYGNFDDSDVIVNANRVAQTFDAPGANANSIEFLVNGTVAFNIGTDANALPNLNVIYKVGDTITYLAVVYTITAIQGGDDDDQVMVVAPAAVIALDATVEWTHNRAAISSNNVKDNVDSTSLQRSEIEMPWKPTCGAFDLKELPAGNYILELVAENETTFQKRVIESLTVDVPADDTAAGIKVEVQKLEFFVAVNGDGEQSSMSNVEIGEWRCRKFNMDGITSSESTQQYTINPRTKSIAVAFTDRLSGSNTLFSPSKFKIRPITGNTDFPSGEMALSKLLVRYNDQVKPFSTPTPRFGKPQDYVSELYTTTMAYNGLLNGKGIWREGGNESKNTWILRGPYYHFVFANKPQYDRRELDITYEFQADLDQGSAAGLVFNYFMNPVSL